MALLKFRKLPSILNRALCGTNFMTGTIETEVIDEDIFLIGINRPEKRNCLNAETAARLIEAVDQFEKGPYPVAILYGKGGNFCAGYDLKEISESGIQNKSLKEYKIKRPMGPTKMPTSKPIIASVNGFAVAGGLELALWCDLRVVEESAILGVFNRRFGVPLIDGGTVRLPRLIGLSQAMDLILTGRRVLGSEAFSMGLANRIVPTGAALGQAVAVAVSIRKFPQACLLADRRSAYYSTFDASGFEDAMDYELENSWDVIEQEGIAGAQKFINEGIGKRGSSNPNVSPDSFVPYAQHDGKI